MEDLPMALSESIESTFRIIEVKINYSKQECEEGFGLKPPDEIYSVLAYFQDLKIDIVFATAGIHVNGKSKRPHLHWHLIVRDLPSGTFQTENSKHRKRWLAKEGNEEYSFDEVTFRFPKKKEDPVWQVLAYPYKEGLVCDHKPLQIIKKEFQSFLIAYGQDLYQVSLGLRARQDAADERRRAARDEMEEFAKAHRDRFSNWKEFKEFMEDNYLAKLEVIPCFTQYKVNLQIVGRRLGIFRYCDYI